MFLDKTLTDSQDMHDREDTGLLEVGLLNLAKFWKEATHMGRAIFKARRSASSYEGVDFTTGQEC